MIGNNRFEELEVMRENLTDDVILDAIVNAMSEDEAKNIFDFIEDTYDIRDNREEE